MPLLSAWCLKISARSSEGKLIVGGEPCDEESDMEMRILTDRKSRKNFFRLSTCFNKHLVAGMGHFFNKKAESCVLPMCAQPDAAGTPEADVEMG